MSVKELDDKSFAEAKESDKAVVKFFADWCGPCKVLAPVYEEISNKLSGVNFFSVDGDKAESTMEEYGVMSFPTMILLEKGKEKDRIIGAVDGEELEGEIKKKFNI